MKKMLSTTGILLFFIAALLSGCAKQNDGSDDDETTPTTNCKLTGQTTGDLYSNSQHYSLEYDANGNPSKITIPSGSTQITETIEPTKMVFKETSGSVNRYISYPGSYLDKQPASAVVGSDNSANIIPFAFTYESNGKIATVKKGPGNPSGVMDDSQAIVIRITYDDNKDVSTIVYHANYLPDVADRDYATLVATGYDDHPSPYSGLKNGVFLQFTFHWEDTGLDNPRYIFDQLSTHNVLGYTLTYHNSGGIAETFTYQYNDKGLPIHRDASLGSIGQTPTKKYYDEWEYDCQ
ncbi:MAG: hypothetical protein QM610_01820 [Chitinophagaceae bacterium]